MSKELMWGLDENGIPRPIGATTTPSGAPAGVVSHPDAFAQERNAGSGNEYGVGIGEWNFTQFNPRAASTGTAVGTAGTAGATEVSIGAGAPILLGGIIFESDNSGNALLRDASSIGSSLVARQLDLNTQFDGQKFETGLTVTGTAAGTAFTVKWRPIL